MKSQENISISFFQLTRRHVPEYFNLYKNVNVDKYNFLFYFPSVLPLYAFHLPFSPRYFSSPSVTVAVREEGLTG